ncbi:Aspartate/glutamate/uridylate kinase [Gilbertella persicaria]|uniref:Isopentenyl phosphate kinase n=1 Tax=Rhizopus stolonifer TaxID=4846 RepID=A0A367J075_RHIST|nr:Aspartate/glutamate/uridylate kinase [Gilbertella persicaria]KAI8091065.1 Aspartate/glutamate/uridylate kinase [Gilbertella persicaria]RCH83343.1 hypothetical protein CU098_005297 [Rhizopus stolonifer]
MIVIVKLGGAAITNKKGVCEFAPKQDLAILLGQIATAYQTLKTKGHQLVLVHGAGSFGHPQATQYQLKTGWSNTGPSPDFIKGYAHIRACLQQLNSAMTSELEARHVPVLSMSPIDYIVTDDCEHTPADKFRSMADRVKEYLRLGFVPMLHGDAVLDMVRGCTILSGDVIMYQLTKLVSDVSRCVFVTDVAGIYQHDPKLIRPEQGKNELLPHVIVKHQDHHVITDVTVADVTGGMQGKVAWAKKIVTEFAERKVDAVICQSGKTEAWTMMTLAYPQQGAQMTLFTFE